MKLLIVISSAEPENAWNAFRLANMSLGKKDDVSVFLLNGGVECLKDGGKYNVKTLAGQFEGAGGRLLACGTCVKSREMGESCPVSNMETLYRLISESEKLVSL